MRCDMLINGFSVHASFDDASVISVFKPLLIELARLYSSKKSRVVAFIAAPPAAGKSTLAAFLESLSAEMEGIPKVQAIGMDGFHYPQKYILQHNVLRNGVSCPMKDYKGAPDTFDIAFLTGKINELYEKATVMWPFYDRRLHDVQMDAIEVNTPIVLLEGNYLLLDAPKWRDLKCDYSVFITADEEFLRKRLVERKSRGGASLQEAEAFYERCDGPNVRLCLENSLPADLTLRITGDGEFRKV